MPFRRRRCHLLRLLELQREIDDCRTGAPVTCLDDATEGVEDFSGTSEVDLDDTESSTRLVR